MDQHLLLGQSYRVSMLARPVWVLDQANLDLSLVL